MKKLVHPSSKLLIVLIILQFVLASCDGSSSDSHPSPPGRSTVTVPLPNDSDDLPQAPESQTPSPVAEPEIEDQVPDIKEYFSDISFDFEVEKSLFHSREHCELSHGGKIRCKMDSWGNGETSEAKEFARQVGHKMLVNYSIVSQCRQVREGDSFTLEAITYRSPQTLNVPLQEGTNFYNYQLAVYEGQWQLTFPQFNFNISFKPFDPKQDGSKASDCHIALYDTSFFFDLSEAGLQLLSKSPMRMGQALKYNESQIQHFNKLIEISTNPSDISSIVESTVALRASLGDIQTADKNSELILREVKCSYSDYDHLDLELADWLSKYADEEALADKNSYVLKSSKAQKVWQQLEQKPTTCSILLGFGAAGQRFEVYSAMAFDENDLELGHLLPRPSSRLGQEVINLPIGTDYIIVNYLLSHSQDSSAFRDFYQKIELVEPAEKMFADNRLQNILNQSFIRPYYSRPEQFNPIFRLGSNASYYVSSLDFPQLVFRFQDFLQDDNNIAIETASICLRIDVDQECAQEWNHAVQKSPASIGVNHHFVLSLNRSPLSEFGSELQTVFLEVTVRGKVFETFPFQKTFQAPSVTLFPRRAQEQRDFLFEFQIDHSETSKEIERFSLKNSHEINLDKPRLKMQFNCLETSSPRQSTFTVSFALNERFAKHELSRDAIISELIEVGASCAIPVALSGIVVEEDGMTVQIFDLSEPYTISF